VKAPLKTRDVCQLLGVRYHTIFNLIRYEKLPAPERDSAGDFIWWPKNVEAARNAVKSNERKVSS